MECLLFYTDAFDNDHGSRPVYCGVAVACVTHPLEASSSGPSSKYIAACALVRSVVFRRERAETKNTRKGGSLTFVTAGANSLTPLADLLLLLRAVLKKYQKLYSLKQISPSRLGVTHIFPCKVQSLIRNKVHFLAIPYF